MATITATVTSVLTKTVASASSTSTSRAAPQGGILEGGDPSHYDPKNPIILFIIQAGIIIIFCRLLHWPLSKIRQPRVIAEVIGGILLGPSVMGRVPGFTNAIFPAAATPNLTLVANLGLVLFLFMVGLEVDLRFLASNWRTALSVGVASMALPFGLGCAIAYGLYHEFRNEPGTEPIAFGTYLLFIGTAMAITAFPVLCRILTELKLLSTSVGIIVLSAGVGNDVVGWILLALCVALVNAGSGLTALWVLLTALGYTLFLFFAVKPAFLWVLRRTRSLENGPSQSVVALTLLLVLTSAFFTGAIGIHPIFGAFMAGLICPHDGGFAIKLTEKIEDLVTALFLPLYFALSGLSTNLGLLDNGITWAYVVGVIVTAFCSKFIAGSVAARFNGLVWRESFTIGALMSCKGLVELIVLNIGLSAKILSQRTFTIFVVMALVTTFATTPLTRSLYPPEYQKKLEAWKQGLIDWDTGRSLSNGDDSSIMTAKLESAKARSLLVYLRLENMPCLLTFVSLLGGRPRDGVSTTHPSKEITDTHESKGSSSQSLVPAVEVHGVRLVELTERESSVMKVSEVDEYSWRDPIINTFRNFGRLYNLRVSGEVAITPESSFAEVLAQKASHASSDMILLPWSDTGSMTERQLYADPPQKQDRGSYRAFVAQTLRSATCTTAVLVNRGFGGSSSSEPPPSPLTRTPTGLSLRSHREPASPLTDQSHHIFMPYFGGADGRAALRLVLQLAENPAVTATIIHFENSSMAEDLLDGHSPAIGSFADRAFGTSASKSPASHQQHATELENRHASFFLAVQKSLPSALAPRVLLQTVQTGTPLEDATARAQAEVGSRPGNAGDLVVVARTPEALVEAGSSVGCLGILAERFVESGLRASVLVVQARRQQQQHGA